MDSAAPLLRLRGLGKCYAGPVLSDVDLDVVPGRVYALIGANGAGKSTLAKIISGLVRADAGAMCWDGAPYRPGGKADAERRGIQIVQQELNLIGSLSVAENLFLNALPARGGWIDRRALRERAEQALAAMRLTDVDPDQRVEQLGVGGQQLVEIAAALSRPCRLLILDEPTAALTDPQIDVLFEHLLKLKQQGVAIIYISHRMEELRRIADTAVILRDGRLVVTEAFAALTLEEMIRHMVGRTLVRGVALPSRATCEVGLRVEGLTRKGAFDDVSFSVNRGEIFGIAGLVGSGRTELLRAIFGADRADRGTVTVGAEGVPARYRHPRQAVRAGIGMIPEDRKRHGLLLTLPVRVNISLGFLPNLSAARSWIDRRREVEGVQREIARLEIHPSDGEHRAGNLSGGNQQKVVIGRWLLRGGRVLLFDEPTRGVDVGARQAVYRLMRELAEAGKTIVVVSSDIEELMLLSDRVGVLSAGRLTAMFDRDKWSQEQIMNAAFAGYQE